MRCLPRIRAALPLAACFQLVATVSLAEVVVVRHDGTRVVADHFSPRTNAERLAVRRERPGIVLTRFVDWGDIASVTVDGHPAGFERLRRSAGLDDANPLDERMKRPVFSEPVSESVSLQAADPLAERPIRESARAERSVTRGSLSSGFVCVAPGASSTAPHEPLWLASPLPTRGVVVGVWDDPLSAYADIIGTAYPYGVPVSEAGFALHVLRGARLQYVLGYPVIEPSPPFAPQPEGFEGAPHSIPPAPEPAW